MKAAEGFRGIDGFRLAAAAMVVALHTSPLASYSAGADWFLTRVLCRLAVPFFFTASGFFLVSRYQKDAGRLRRFLKKTAALYGVGMLLYLPLNLYSGAFAGQNGLLRFLRSAVFEGTFYHLWYLPAALLGGSIAYFAVWRLGYRRAFLAAGALYVLGLLGDSYFGLAAQSPLLRRLYSQVFLLCGPTRNGLFFAPLFFVLGGWCAGSKQGWQKKGAAGDVCAFLLCFLLMAAEAVLLRALGWPRQDSMLAFLPPCVLFLFRALCRIPGGRLAWAGSLSRNVYLLHPWVIVAVRAAARLLGLWRLLVENSAAHFLAVCLGSAAGGAVAAVFSKLRPPRKGSASRERAWVEVNLKNLAHNARALQSALPQGCALMAVVKAEAYGHGGFETAVCLERAGVTAFAVATIDEGIALRRYGIRGEILVLGVTDVGRAKELRRYGLAQTLPSLDYARALDAQKAPLKVHVKIDTGMHRLGIDSRDLAGVREALSLCHLTAVGIYTHLCCADGQTPEDEAFTNEQVRRFYALLERLKRCGIPLPKHHVQSSYGILNLPGLRCDYARAGIVLYGVPSSPGVQTRLQLDLRPVLSVKARVSLVRAVSKGETVGYGRRFTAQRESRIAVLAIGYADGLPRGLSGPVGRVRIGEKVLPIAGRVCMDQLMVDVTDAPNTAPGDVGVLVEATATGALSAPRVAERLGSISNELLCRRGARLPVVCVEE